LREEHILPQTPFGLARSEPRAIAAPQDARRTIRSISSGKVLDIDLDWFRLLSAIMTVSF